ncbi:antigen WC1.1 isoform X2 [Esox lucius]|uniref:antigen WC1.1 isoform X2 n=1 Tax=Esox lucius TaxID=8010 RepID=UPI0014774C52|nr:antigen WC1.1 isoform X2 [Esox lucius]
MKIGVWRSLLHLTIVCQMALSSLAAEEIRLVNGSSRCSGRVEVLYEGQWGRVCGQNWDINDANVVCVQLGCGRAKSVLDSAQLGHRGGGGTTWLDNVGCRGNESYLTECSHGGLKHQDCFQAKDAIAVCSVKPNIRLVNGTDLCSGRVEVYQAGQWKTVCGDTWDLQDVNVVCRQLGCGKALWAPEKAYFGQGSGPIWQQDVACSDSLVLQKPSLSIDPSYSDILHGEQVQLTCNLPTLIPCNAVEFIFNLNGDSVMNVTVGSSQSRVMLTQFKMDASHQGRYSCLYRTTSNGQAVSSPYSNSTEVVLLHPKISLIAPNRSIFWGSKGSEVTRGHSFSITCSIQPRYPGGLFHLDFSGSNRTETKPAVNHSASFHFPVAGYKHEGNYRCSYEVNVSTWALGSAKSNLTVTIRASMVPFIASGGTGVLILLSLFLVVLYLVRKRTRGSRNPSTETNQRECTENRYNRWEENEEEPDYVNLENLCYGKCPERVNGELNREKITNNYGKAEDGYVNGKEREGKEEIQNKGVLGVSCLSIISDSPDEDYVNVSVQDSTGLHSVNEDFYQNVSKVL